MIRRAITASTLFLCAGSALAQSFNIDFERLAGNGIGAPGTGYKAAHGQGGFWNMHLITNTGIATVLDTNESPTNVTIQRTGSAQARSTPIAGAQTNYDRLMADYAYSDTLLASPEYTIKNLSPGVYRAYIYSHLPGDDGWYIDATGGKSWYTSYLTATLDGATIGSGNTFGAATVNTFKKGVTHAIIPFKVASSAQVLKVRASGEWNEFGHERCALNGLQVEKITATRLYVNKNATGANDGLSWAHAFTDLQHALNLAKAATGQITEIWVAKGEYTPTAGPNRGISFNLVGGVSLLGGFNGTEVSAAERDPEMNATLLTGAIGSSATPDNSYHVIRAVDLAAAPIVDGFWIVGGWGGTIAPDDRGAGMYIKNAHPIVRNCHITGHDSTFGAGVYAESSSAVFENCSIDASFASFDGGGIYYKGDENGQYLSCVNTTFRSGYASDEGGAVYIAGGDAVFSNCLFHDNDSDAGGGAITVANPNASTVGIFNCTLAENRCPNGTGGIWAGTGSTVNIRNSILWKNYGLPGLGTLSGQFYATNGGAVSTLYSCVQTQFASPIPGTGNTKADPLFIDPNGPDNIPDTADDDYRLMPLSPASDAGNNTSLALDYSDLDRDAIWFEYVPFDKDMNARRIDGPMPDTGSGSAPIVDMGCYEVEKCTPDCENDGDLDVFDFLCFQNKFAAKDPYADFELDGDWDVFDFLAFQNAFAQGCE